MTNKEVEKKTAKDILQCIYDLCKIRKEIEWDDVYFLLKRYSIEVDE